MAKRMLIVLVLGLVAGAVTAKPLIDGTAAAGKSKSTPCAACHGADGNSSNPQWPKLAGQHATYIYRQLKNFKSGKRKNGIMAGQAGGLSDQDMKDLAVYFSQQPIKPGVADKKLVERGGKLYRSGDADAGVPACSGCHGPSGLGNAAAAYPRIGGQQAQYVSAQLQAFRSGQRGTTEHAQIMDGVAKKLTDKDIQALASYVQGLQPRQQ